MIILVRSVEYIFLQNGQDHSDHPTHDEPPTQSNKTTNNNKKNTVHFFNSNKNGSSQQTGQLLQRDTPTGLTARTTHQLIANDDPEQSHQIAIKILSLLSKLSIIRDTPQPNDKLLSFELWGKEFIIRSAWPLDSINMGTQSMDCSTSDSGMSRLDRSLQKHKLSIQSNHTVPFITY
ncbi:hypothetical protein PSTT_06991 [Puccinia striiformis]|uniref:Uncharacterized protein n=1 Tax=Puccinia striiformis TaxID=27350 RepID=A0A2S4VI82_9BASI|nr:hypothetical protein PSTT_06991 [Puccinia striiformis]